MGCATSISRISDGLGYGAYLYSPNANCYQQPMAVYTLVRRPNYRVCCIRRTADDGAHLRQAKAYRVHLTQGYLPSLYRDTDTDCAHRKA